MRDSHPKPAAPDGFPQTPAGGIFQRSPFYLQYALCYPGDIQVRDAVPCLWSMGFQTRDTCSHTQL